jgi:ATP-dependent Zn protease
MSKPLAIVGGVFALLLLLAFFNLFSTPTRPARRLPLIDYSRFITDVDEGKVYKVAFRGPTGSTIAGEFKDGRPFESSVPHVQVIPSLTDRLLAKGVTIGARVSPDEDAFSLLSLASSWFPLLVCYALLYFFFARPVLALARQIEAYVRIAHSGLAGPPSPPS